MIRRPDRPRLPEAGPPRSCGSWSNGAAGTPSASATASSSRAAPPAAASSGSCCAPGSDRWRSRSRWESSSAGRRSGARPRRRRGGFRARAISPPPGRGRRSAPRRAGRCGGDPRTVPRHRDPRRGGGEAGAARRRPGGGWSRNGPSPSFPASRWRRSPPTAPCSVPASVADFRWAGASDLVLVRGADRSAPDFAGRAALAGRLATALRVGRNSTAWSRNLRVEAGRSASGVALRSPELVVLVTESDFLDRLALVAGLLPDLAARWPDLSRIDAGCRTGCWSAPARRPRRTRGSPQGEPSP